MKESIMPNGMYQSNGHTYFYSNQRYDGTHRHEIFFGTANRKKSIDYGLYVYLLPQDHNASIYGVHSRLGKDFNLYLKKKGQLQAMVTYNWTVDDFIKIFGKSYL